MLQNIYMEIFRHLLPTKNKRMFPLWGMWRYVISLSGLLHINYNFFLPQKKYINWIWYAKKVVDLLPTIYFDFIKLLFEAYQF